MTKKQYFMFLLLLCSMSPMYYIMKNGLTASGTPLVNHPLVQLIMHGVGLFFGLYFAQKIGMKLLFVDGQYNFVGDIIKPAVIIGVLYAGAILIINAAVHILPGHIFWCTSYVELFDQFLRHLFYSIRWNLFALLFCMSGVTFIIKKLAKNVAIATIFPIVIGASVLLVHIPLLFDCFVRFHCGLNVIVGSLFPTATLVLLSMLFWKKGLETALLCDVVIMTILYLIAPAVVLALSA